MPLYSQLDLLLSVLNRVRTVADVAADSESIVTTDGAFANGCIRRPIRLDGTRSDSPGAEARGLVAPSMTRPVFTASRPSQTIATTGPADMYLTRPGKKGLPLRSA